MWICIFLENGKLIKVFSTPGELRLNIDDLLYSSASNRIIHAKDHASVQINIADVDPNSGIMTNSFKSYAICGDIRKMGESDDCILRLAKRDGIIPKTF